jgi:UDP-glucuronate 4-epimerase
MKPLLVPGTARFIGFHLAKLLLAEGFIVHGYDGMSDYYDMALERRRQQMLLQLKGFTATEALLEDLETLDRSFDDFRPDVIVHLADQARVRHSLENPRTYLNANVIGTFNAVEAARRLEVDHLLVASTSSVYGATTDMPFVETKRADTRLTIYAASEKANESAAHAPAHLRNLPKTMLQSFYRLWPLGASGYGAV